MPSPKRPRFYLTTAIYYANDVAHLGHAFEVIGADVQARFRRLLGHPVFFLTGTDEHGQKVADSAAKVGMSPAERVDQVAASFQNLFRELLITNDDFIRTTQPRHHRSVQELWRTVERNGDLYLGSYEGWYDVKDETFITETEMEAKGLKPDGVRIKKMAEPTWFFRLSKYTQRLIEYIEANPSFIQPKIRANEVVNSFLKAEGGLPDLSVSRTSFNWGIPVPNSPGHVTYVWFDALTNYITGVGYGDPEQRERFAEWWPADVHVVGKDILKFHCAYWPAMLWAAGIEAPRQIFGHGFITVKRDLAPPTGQVAAGEEGKMSKSFGNVIDPRDYIARIGADALRYFLMREINYGGDGAFSESALVTRYNADLANGIGNHLARITNMVEKYCAGVAELRPEAEYDELEQAVVAGMRSAVADYEKFMPGFEYHVALASVWTGLDALSRLINERAPWAMAKDPAKKADLARLLGVCAEALRLAVVMISPFLPTKAADAWRQLGFEKPIEEYPWEDLSRWGGVAPTRNVVKGEGLFPRVVAAPPSAS